MKRTHRCGDLRVQDIGKEVCLSGWVHRRRDHGGLIFIDLRDREGITQLVINPDVSSQVHTIAQKLGPEDVISAAGKVVARPQGTENPKIKTGTIEISVGRLEILNKSQTPPFEIEDETEINEELRLVYRYLDLRRPKMQKNLRMRHELFQVVREVLDQQGFWEVETPILTKSTPEGARDYLVPSRLNPGQFFALPQSPQLFKQILMVSGIDRYFQLARCFRDEDLRKDRQPEFTQLDMELAFTDEEEIFAVVEQIMQAVFQKLIGISLKLPLVRMSYPQAMARYGSDKPDLRFGMEISDVSSLFQTSSFKVFRECLQAGGAIQGISVPGAGNFSRSEIDQWTQKAQEWGAKGLAYFKVGAGFKPAP
ncbi:MAG: aspartate--tRNA ligase, partial [Candidatus Omnitrophica bacterium]|nr:aspartate--tRNA ligase [Candidatus Omnitrophota bacterium]